MSYKNRNNITNRIGGQGIGSKAGQSIYDESSTAKFALGEKLEFADGRVFRYGYTGAAIKAGLLVAPDVSTTSVVNTDNALPAASSPYSPAVGSSRLQMTLSGKSANQYAGAYLQINNDIDDAKGEGIQYRIKSNSATAATTAGRIDIELYDPIKVALDTASDVFIQGHPYDELITATTTDTLVTGVSPIAFTANYYGWFQTAGIATVLMETNGTAVPAVGDNLTLGDGTAGACQLAIGTTDVDPIIGIACNVGTTGSFIGVMLRLGAV
jgi:hypothetical protein